MNAEIIAIGNEILSGSVVNTNAAFLSQELSKSGFHIVRHSVIPDENELLEKGLSEALARSQLVVCTGGLGPTCDDTTKSVVAKMFDSALVTNLEILKDLELRFGNRLVSIEDQALVPIKAHLLPNSIGTAYGLVFSKDDSLLVLLPGVPYEMKKMVEEQVIPFLQKSFKNKSICRQDLYFFNTYESKIDPYLRELQTIYPAVKIGIYPSPGYLSVSLSITASSEKEGTDILNEAAAKLKAKFLDHYIYLPFSKIEIALQNHLVAHKKTLSLAESCTGGRIASRLTLQKGCSDYFLGSIVSYSNFTKENILKVNPATLQTYGAVSRETVEEMAEGVLKITGSDYSLAVTGIAGPTGGTPEKPVGTVWFAISSKTKATQSWKMQSGGLREFIIEKSANILLFSFLRYLQEEENLGG